MEFKRDYYLQKLIRAEQNDMVKIVTGVRRCGKSYLLFNIFRNHLLSQGIGFNSEKRVSLLIGCVLPVPVSVDRLA